MLRIALKSKPDFICIVPEKRQEITTEGGLNLKYKKEFLKKLIKKLKRNNSRVSLFIEPTLKDIKMSYFLGANCVEIHTGHGLTFKSAKILSKISGIHEFNIGHFLIGESIFIGLEKSIKQFKKILQK